MLYLYLYLYLFILCACCRVTPSLFWFPHIKKGAIFFFIYCLALFVSLSLCMLLLFIVLSTMLARCFFSSWYRLPPPCTLSTRGIAINKRL